MFFCLFSCRARAKTDLDYSRLIEIIGEHHHEPNKATGKETVLMGTTYKAIGVKETSNRQTLSKPEVEFLTNENGQKTLIIDEYKFKFAKRTKHFAEFVCICSEMLK